MTINELKDIMKSFQTSDFPNASAELLSHISKQNSLLELLNSIMIDSEEQNRVSTNSFFHNLGFIRIGLIGWETSNCMLKMHVWNNAGSNNLSQASSRTDSIHDHLYDFRSVVVVGELTFEIFTDCGGDDLYHKYRNPLAKDEYIFCYEGNASLTRKLEVHLGQGGSYHIDHTVLHRTSVKRNSPTITICLQSEVKKRHTFIYSQEQLMNLPKCECFDSSMLVERLREITTIIQNG